VTIFQTQLFNELAAGPDGEPISESKLVYLQERLRGRFFDFLIERFENARNNSGLNQAKLARRIRKPPEVVNRWLGAPSNLTLDSMSDLLAGIAAEEPDFSPSSLLGRAKVNYFEPDDLPATPPSPEAATDNRRARASALDDKNSEEKDAPSATKMAYAE
jgi:hypothetical protein